MSGIFHMIGMELDTIIHILALFFASPAGVILADYIKEEIL